MRQIFDVIANEWRPWFRKFKVLPGKQQQTWLPWFSFLRILFGSDLSASDLELFRQCTGRTDAPAGGFNEAWLCCGRRSGKSRMLAMAAIFLAVFRDWTPYLSPGERATVAIIAADRKQARVIFGYAREFLKVLADVTIERETLDTLELSNGITVEIMTADFRTLRGYTIVAALGDEACFWSNEGANPDQEILTALKPAMATVPGAMLLFASSPYAKRGIMYDAYRNHYGRDGDDVLFWKSPTRTMNPSVSEAFIKAEYEKDPASAAAEYGAEFRDDISSFVASDVIDNATLKGLTVIPPSAGVQYTGFIDISGGRHDSHVVAIAFQDMSGASTLACAREVKSADVEGVAAEFATLLKSYGVNQVYSDEYAAQWPRAAFQRNGITVVSSPLTRSGLYLNLIPMLTSGKAKLLDIPKLRQQLLALERRTARTTGKDIVDHPVGGADDVGNCVAGAIVMNGRASGRSWGVVGVPSPGQPDHVGRSFEDYVAEAKAAAAAGETSLADQLWNDQRRAILGRDWRDKIK